MAGLQAFVASVWAGVKPVPQVTGWCWRGEGPLGRQDGTKTMPLMNMINQSEFISKCIVFLHLAPLICVSCGFGSSHRAHPASSPPQRHFPESWKVLKSSKMEFLRILLNYKITLYCMRSCMDTSIITVSIIAVAPLSPPCVQDLHSPPDWAIRNDFHPHCYIIIAFL